MRTLRYLISNIFISCGSCISTHVLMRDKMRDAAFYIRHYIVIKRLSHRDAIGFHSIRCNSPDISYFSEMQNNNFQFLCKAASLKNTKIGFKDQLSLNAGQKYCRILQGDHSAIILTFIKLPFVIKIFVLTIFEWPFYTRLAVLHIASRAKSRKH